MTIRVAINGFGRIGRLVFRVLVGAKEVRRPEQTPIGLQHASLS